MKQTLGGAHLVAKKKELSAAGELFLLRAEIRGRWEKPNIPAR
jgi:hypothetical protein